jgi:hypothetical protein
VLSVSNVRCPELHYEELYDSYTSLKIVKVIKDEGDRKCIWNVWAKCLEDQDGDIKITLRIFGK